VENFEHSWESDGQDCSKAKAYSYGPSHTDLTVRKGEDLCGIGEWNRAFSRRVPSCKMHSLSAPVVPMSRSGVFAHRRKKMKSLTEISSRQVMKELLD